jgi:hypothetical protein
MFRPRNLLSLGALLAALALGALPARQVGAAPPVIGPCQVFPTDNAWNTDISNAAVHPNSKQIINTINAFGGDNVHPDFGENPAYGIPWTTVAGNTQPGVPIEFDYEDESDPGPYPIPEDAPIEGGGDKHVLVVDTDNCILYEMFNSRPQGTPITLWKAGSGAVWDLNSNAMRPDTWTSADAAGLPILPGLARCEEAESGVIDHALRVTFSRTQKSYIYPASHYASSYTRAQYPYYPPMGLRFRLKAGYNISNLTGQARAIAEALKKYGMIVADNGSNWFISGETSPGCWDDDNLNALKRIPGTAFEVIASPPPPRPDGERIINGGFEGQKPDRKPMKWTLTNPTGDRRICNVMDADNPEFNVIHAAEGQCAFAFKSSKNENSSLTQKVNASGIGAAVTVSAQVRAAGLAEKAARVVLQVTHTDNTKKNYIVFLPTDTGGAYQDFSQVVTFAKPVKALTVVVRFTGKAGSLTLDELSLVDGDGSLAASALRTP